MPLTLLLLATEHGRARLRAFANVPLSLHVGLQDDVVNYSRLFRICEWASQSGSWQLRDHHNAIVGSVTGVVTLSCLGKALAPHLKQALGVQVNKSQPASPRVEADEKTTQKYAVDGHVIYHKSTSRKGVTSSPRSITQRHNRELPRVDRVAVIKDNLLLPRELPPPLFFQKLTKS
ncbi:hypothetical protein PHMEG_00030353 [Phytophthora megakarya]|uniref:Uncharacterized protein n=1 Tax=Phytophthora megakarya TaxID=4795 RepID=A0A225V0I8_9STRA|nr:hypothetical protein PHMEG_00030353 [Phytophthora megakarya]